MFRTVPKDYTFETGLSTTAEASVLIFTLITLVVAYLKHSTHFILHLRHLLVVSMVLLLVGLKWQLRSVIILYNNYYMYKANS